MLSSSTLATRAKAPAADFSLAIINVVFLLLFFFILTGSIVQPNEMEVRAPFTRNLPLERLPRPLIVISKDNLVFLDGRPTDIDAIVKTINNVDRQSAEKFTQINILAEQSLAAKTFLASLDKLRRTGLPIRIVTVRTRPKAPEKQ